jgi:hypothetical protein
MDKDKMSLPLAPPLRRTVSHVSESDMSS